MRYDLVQTVVYMHRVTSVNQAAWLCFTVGTVYQDGVRLFELVITVLPLVRQHTEQRCLLLLSS